MFPPCQHRQTGRQVGRLADRQADRQACSSSTLLRSPSPSADYLCSRFAGVYSMCVEVASLSRWPSLISRGFHHKMTSVCHSFQFVIRSLHLILVTVNECDCCTCFLTQYPSSATKVLKHTLLKSSSACYNSSWYHRWHLLLRIVSQGSVSKKKKPTSVSHCWWLDTKIHWVHCLYLHALTNHVSHLSAEDKWSVVYVSVTGFLLVRHTPLYQSKNVPHLKMFWLVYTLGMWLLWCCFPFQSLGSGDVLHVRVL